MQFFFSALSFIHFFLFLVFFSHAKHTHTLLYFIQCTYQRRAYPYPFIICESSVCLIKTENIAFLALPYFFSGSLLLLHHHSLFQCKCTSYAWQNILTVCIHSLRDYLALERLDAIYLYPTVFLLHFTYYFIFPFFFLLLFPPSVCWTSSLK